MRLDRIIDVRASLIDSRGAGGDYHDRDEGHWLVDTLIATPMSGYPDYKASRTSWGIAVLGSILVEIETEGGFVGVATGLGGPPACFMIEHHFRRFLVGSEPRDINRMWDQMYRASMPYGRKGITVAALSAVDLALWDLVGHIRQEPVWAMIGGKVRDDLALYCTGPKPAVAKKQGFFGAKVPLPEGPEAGLAGLQRNVEFLAAHRAAVGPDFPLMVDCYMSLDVPYAVDLATALKPLGIHWIEEALPPTTSRATASSSPLPRHALDDRGSTNIPATASASSSRAAASTSCSRTSCGGRPDGGPARLGHGGGL